MIILDNDEFNNVKVFINKLENGSTILLKSKPTIHTFNYYSDLDGTGVYLIDAKIESIEGSPFVNISGKEVSYCVAKNKQELIKFNKFDEVACTKYVADLFDVGTRILPTEDLYVDVFNIFGKYKFTYINTSLFRSKSKRDVSMFMTTLTIIDETVADEVITDEFGFTY